MYELINFLNIGLVKDLNGNVLAILPCTYVDKCHTLYVYGECGEDIIVIE